MNDCILHYLFLFIQEMHKCLICIGSNYRRQENLPMARRILQNLFPNIKFACECETKPLFFKSPALFSNQVAFFFSDKNMDELKQSLKKIEREAGRKPEDKEQEKVCLDIDLLLFDDHILKPEDLKRDYILLGLSELENDLRNH